MAEISEKKLQNMITGALIDTINVHGPITKQLAQSATKRIIGTLKNNVTLSEPDSKPKDQEPNP